MKNRFEIIKHDCYCHNCEPDQMVYGTSTSSTLPESHTRSKISVKQDVYPLKQYRWIKKKKNNEKKLFELASRLTDKGKSIDITRIC